MNNYAQNWSDWAAYLEPSQVVDESWRWTSRY